MQIAQDGEWLAGLGLPTAEVVRAIQDFSQAEEPPFVTNVSRMKDAIECETAYWCRYVENKTLRADPTSSVKPSLVLGTALHRAVELFLRGSGAERAAAEAISEHDEVLQTCSEYHHTVLENGFQWIQDVMPVFEERFGRNVRLERIIGLEQPLWLYHRGENVLFVGRADIVGLDEAGQIVHVQIKTRSKELPDVEGYASLLSFSPHEIIYGKALEVVAKAGAHPEIPHGTAYGGSHLLIFFKTPKPSGKVRTLAKEFLAAAAAGQVLFYDEKNLELSPHVANAKRERLAKNWRRWALETAKVKQDMASWPIRVIRHIEMDLDGEKMESHLRPSLAAARLQKRLHKTDDVWDLTRNTNACNKYGATCNYSLAQCCGGYSELVVGSEWHERMPDYVDEVKDLFERTWNDA